MTANHTTHLEGRRLIVIGAGDLGRELCAWFPDLGISAFLDSRVSHWSDPSLPPIIGSPDTYWPQPNDVFLCGVGNPAARLAVARNMEARGGKFISAIHHTALIADSSSLGTGSIVLPYAIIDVNSHLGDHSLLYFRSGVGHDATLDAGCVLLSNAIVGSRCVLGECVVVSTLAFCNTGIAVGAHSLIGASSFAARDVPARSSAIGVPARIVSVCSERPAPAAAVAVAV